MKSLEQHRNGRKENKISLGEMRKIRTPFPLHPLRLWREIFLLSLCLLFFQQGIKSAPTPPKEATPALFSNSADALATLLNADSRVQWDASAYLKAHPEGARERLMELISNQHPSYYIAMVTLTGIGGPEVVRFYCGLLDKKPYETDALGKRIEYGLGKPGGCIKSHYLYGKALVEQIGTLRDKTSEASLLRAWKDSDEAVKAAIPKARFDIGTLSLKQCQELALRDEKNRNLYLDTLLSIAHENIHHDTDAAIALFEWLASHPELDNEILTGAHSGVVQCYELKGDFGKALIHNDWVIQHATSKEMAERRTLERSLLLYQAKKLSLDELFAWAGKNEALYDRIAQLGRSGSPALLDRIVREAPTGSQPAMEAHYWRREYYLENKQLEKAEQETAFLLKHCKVEHVLNWVRKDLAKQKEMKEKTLASAAHAD